MNYTMFFVNMLAKFEIYIIYYINYIIKEIDNLILRAYIRINFILNSKLNCMKKIVKISIISFATLLLLIGVIFGSFFVYINTSQRSVQFDKTMLQEVNTSIDIYDIQNKKINDKIGKKALVRYEELPNYVKNAFVSIEDKDFYKHNGLNYKRIAKAFVNNIKSRSLKEGASTISQQLIKNTHLSSEKTIKRKLDEMSLAIQLEKNFTKDEILETYLNVIYFGSGAYGLENASEIYFGKTANELSIAESATLAGMIKSPKTYSPLLNMDKSLNRRNLVLSEMKKDGIITEEQFIEAKNQPIILTTKQKSSKNFYEEATIKEAISILNVTEQELALGGYKIFTYQNPSDQKSLSKTITNTDYYMPNSYGNIADGCGVVIDNKTGGITAFDGKSIYDIITMKRSPGSSLKPILVYAPALENGKISPITPILDEKTNFGKYTPQNVGDKYYGWIDCTKSIEKSLNIPAIKIMQINGIENSKKMASDCGIQFCQQDNNYALALGAVTNGTSVVELANTYLPFANNGNFIKAKFIKKICGKNGNVIYENPQETKQVMSEETAYLMTEMLVSSVKKGTSSRLNNLGFEIAGKTGTVGIKGTNLNSDVWSVGYTPQKTVCCWLGNSTGDKKFMLEGKNNGGTFCTSIVRDTFDEIDMDRNAKFEKPNNIVSVDLDLMMLEKEHTMLVANSLTADRYKIKANFNKKYAPTTIAEPFEILNFITISTKLVNNKPKIQFDTIKNATYKLYRIEEDTCKLLKEFKNVSGNQEFVDTNIQDDTSYIYFVECKTDDNKTIKSNSEKVKTNSTNALKKIFNFW